MAVRQLLLKWLRDANNKAYLSELSIEKQGAQNSGCNDKIVFTKSVPLIKPFFPMKRSQESIQNEKERISVSFKKLLNVSTEKNGLTMEEFESVTVGIFGFSKYCNSLLFNKILSSTTKSEEGSDIFTISLSMLMEFWSKYFSENEDISFRFVQLLKSKDSNNYLEKQDFFPLITHVLHSHPGLAFLRDSTEFRDFYVLTVICRIFYYVDTNKDNRITVRELAKSDFLNIFSCLDEEHDINEIFEYFSYEHFYVIYTKFWELDEDGDNLLTYDDLIKYEDYSLTPKVIQRIIGGSAKTMKEREAANEHRAKETMDYEDFVTFIISEEDKTNSESINYWFRILDIDGDGVLSPYELEMFFEEQSEKLFKVCGETLTFENILITLNDMIKPKEPYKFTLRDIKKSGMASMFFNTITNINKFAKGEEKDLTLINQIRESPHMTDWDRFASTQYFELST